MTATQIALIVVALVVVAAIGYLIVRQQRTKALRSRFGPEYTRAVDEYGSQGRAEAALAKREKRVQKLSIHPLEPDARSRFSARWRTVQARFVDDPAASIGDADRLVAEVMNERGYPMADFEQRAADISVDHPDVVEHYRTAHDIAQSHRQRPVSTEDLRKAFLHYRALFASLLEVEPAQVAPSADGRPAPAAERKPAPAADRKPASAEQKAQREVERDEQQTEVRR